MKLRLIIVLFFSLIVLNAKAQLSMRRCILLPIGDTVQGGIGHGVFQAIEGHIKEGNWCYYRFNSDIMDILSHYKNNLSKHLDNPDILKVIADRSKAGTLIKINLRPYKDGIETNMKIIGENGKDIYFKERSRTESLDLDRVISTVKNWLAVYEKSIPYHGRVIGVLGNQVSFDIGSESGLTKGDILEVLRPKGKRVHPLLKEVVAWQSKKVGDAKVVYSAPSQGQANIYSYDGNIRAEIGDWVKMTNSKKNVEPNQETADDDDPFKFGKLGELGVFLNFGYGSDTVGPESGDVNKVGGYLYGITLKSELWATRNFFGVLEFSKRFGTFNRLEGSLVGSPKNNVSFSTVKAKFGYRYLPLGFFYGPRVDGYFGFGRNSFGMDNRVSDGFVESSIKGILLGIKGSMPVIRFMRVYVDVDFLLRPGYSEDVTVHGDADSVSGVNFEAGVTYKIAPQIRLSAAFEYTSNIAKFESSNTRVSFKETSGNFGAIYTF